MLTAGPLRTSDNDGAMCIASYRPSIRRGPFAGGDGGGSHHQAAALTCRPTRPRQSHRSRDIVGAERSYYSHGCEPKCLSDGCKLRCPYFPDVFTRRSLQHNHNACDRGPCDRSGLRPAQREHKPNRRRFDAGRSEHFAIACRRYRTDGEWQSLRHGALARQDAERPGCSERQHRTSTDQRRRATFTRRAVILAAVVTSATG